MMLPQRSIEHHVTGLSEMLVVKPAYEDCAQVKDDCLAAGCCAPSGYNCFKNARGQGRCMRECTPGGANGTCEGVAPHMKTAVEVPGFSLFCFSVYTENTGSDKVSHELELLQMQHDNGQSLFSCAQWAVYSDVVVPLGGGDMTIQVEDTKGDWHLLRRKDTRAGSTPGCSCGCGRRSRKQATTGTTIGSSRWMQTQFSSPASSEACCKMCACLRRASTWRIASMWIGATSATWRSSPSRPSRACLTM